MNRLPSSEYDEQDEEIIKLLKDLGSLEATYPEKLLAARRAAYLAQVERLHPADPGAEWATADHEIVKLLGIAKSTQADYPSDLLAARHSAFVRQLERVGRTSVTDRFRLFIQRIFQSERTKPAFSPAGLMRLSLLVASLVAAVFLGSLFTRGQQLFVSSPLQTAATPTSVLPLSTSEPDITICQPGDQASACLPLAGELDPSQDLADPGNGMARPAVSKDAYPAHTARYVNDSRAGTSWVSNSADSWIKIDLGQVRTINTVSLEKGDPVPSLYTDPGAFVIAVALSDVYADGDSSNDHKEYVPVFHSEQAAFSSTDLHTAMIRTRFSPVEARFVKVTFEREGAAIETVRVFMVEPPVLAEQPTRIPQADLSSITLTPIHANTLLAIDTSTSVPTDMPGNTPTVTTAPSQTPTSTPPPSDTPTLLPTDTQPPADTSTPVSTDPLPTEVPPTAIQPTAILPTVQPSSVSTEPIVVTKSDQTLTFTCNGNAVEIRGHANTVILLGSCSSITVTGNGNRVFWQFGSPVIRIEGQDNIIRQL